MRVRKLEKSDEIALEAWLVLAHKGRVKAEIFYQPDSEGYVVEDDSGPCCYLLSRAARRIDMQFDPLNENSIRTAKALVALNSFMEEKEKARGTQELLYESSVPRLTGFMERLGFKGRAQTFVKALKG